MKKIPKFILFTGHRDKLANPVELYELANQYHSSIWIHGGAKGFDMQVDKVAEKFGIQRAIFPPPYQFSNDRSAPLRRNDVMLGLCDMVVALYDGRSSGGTCYTITKAVLLSKPIKILQPFYK